MYELIGLSTRPSRLVTDKDEKYHIDNARFCISDGFNTKHRDWLLKCDINRNFFANNQWFMREDIETFLKDESGQSRNRIMTTINLMRRIFEQYIGNAKNLNITMRAENLSYKAINRREEKLSELLFFTELAKNANEETANFIKSKLPIGNTQEETQDIFENLYVDEYTKAVNNFIEYIFEEEELDKRKAELAMNLCATGLNILKYDIYNNDYKISPVIPERFFFDRTAKELDLTDAEYMGDVDELLPTTIYERYPNISEANKKQIDSAIKSVSNNNANPFIVGGKIPVYKVFWVDTEDVEFGYVKDEFDYPYLTRINYIYEGYDKPRYTDDNLIPLSELNEQQKETLKGKNKATLSVDTIRYAHIIPNEILSNKDSNKKFTDILLESGLLKYQEVDSYKATSVKFPYKANCWYYFNGVVDTPINDLINPQRMINRYESVTENIINTALPANLFYDKSMLDDQEGEAGLLKAKYQGKPYGMRARGQGMHNAVMTSTSTLDAGQIALNSKKSQEMVANMDRIIGLNEPMYGGSTGSEQLVGVTMSQIQRSSLVQEPFYSAIVSVYKQIAQSIVNVARRLYSDDDRKLAIMLGDGKAQVLKLAKDYSPEYFRVFVNHEIDVKTQIQIGNQILLQYLQAQLINKEQFADLYNRSTPEDIADAIRSNVKDERELAKLQQTEKQKQDEQAQLEYQNAIDQQNQQIEKERTDRLVREGLDRETAKEKEMIKAQAKMQPLGVRSE